MVQALRLKNRGILEITGAERKSFLQGLITNDVEKLGPDAPLYAAMLTPQGKYLFDFILVEQGDALYLDCEKDRISDLYRRLMMYKLRADAVIEDVSDTYAIWALWEAGNFSAGKINGITAYAYPDPRHWKMGARALVPKGHNLLLPDDGSDAADPLKADDYEKERIALGIPDGSRDMEVDKFFWLECRAEALNGVDFHKGCYVGQEQTARMKHRTTLKKSIVPVSFSGSAPAIDSEIQTESGKKAGKIKSTAGQLGLAYVRLNFTDEPLTADAAGVTISKDESR